MKLHRNPKIWRPLFHQWLLFRLIKANSARLVWLDKLLLLIKGYLRIWEILKTEFTKMFEEVALVVLWEWCNHIFSAKVIVIHLPHKHHKVVKSAELKKDHRQNCTYNPATLQMVTLHHKGERRTLGILHPKKPVYRRLKPWWEAVEEKETNIKRLINLLKRLTFWTVFLFH